MRFIFIRLIEDLLKLDVIKAHPKATPKTKFHPKRIKRSISKSRKQ
jgi:hypothetical protein